MRETERQIEIDRDKKYILIKIRRDKFCLPLYGALLLLCVATNHILPIRREQKREVSSYKLPFSFNACRCMELCCSCVYPQTKLTNKERENHHHINCHFHLMLAAVWSIAALVFGHKPNLTNKERAKERGIFI